MNYSSAFAAFALIASASVSQALTNYNISSLECEISNGTKIETLSRINGGVRVRTTLGFFRKDFDAYATAFGDGTMASSTMIVLFDGGHASPYQMHLPVKREAGVSTVTGTMNVSGGLDSRPIASANCQVAVEKTED